MKKQILEELKEIRYLFNYNRGKIISEQEQFESEDDNEDNVDDNEDDNEDLNYLKSEYSEEYDFGAYENDLEEEIDFEVPTMEPGTKEKERTKVIPGTKPDEDSPYKPKPGTKKKPKAKKGDMPDWLSFDEIGINIE
jgi:hypothetical protein